ncbi:Protein of unknown function [Bacillus cytotoxicus]|nr:Protein of unknown function [Bacillus cytotoxicus]
MFEKKTNEVQVRQLNSDDFLASEQMNWSVTLCCCPCCCCC